MSGMKAVTRNGPMRSTPCSVASTTSRIIVFTPPMPVPMMTPVRHASCSSVIGLSIPASRSASTVAAQAKWTYRSLRRTSLRGITSSASNSRISPATLLATRDGSKPSMRRMPLRPLTIPSQNDSTSLPSGVSAPRPVTTTRRSPSRTGRASADRLVARDDDAQRRLGGDLAAHARGAAHATEHAAQLLDRDRQLELVAGEHGAPETTLVDAGEQRELAAVLREGQDRDPGRLRQRLDHEHAGQDRPTGEVAGELGLVGGHALDRHRTAPRLQGDHTVHEQKWVA